MDLSLDHVGAIVRDLEGGADRWRRLGFTLTPRSPQMGFDKATGRVQPWATANRCAVFRQGYLELIGVIDQDTFNPWEKFLDRFEGVHITALRCTDADAAYAELSLRSEGLDPPLDRRRQAPYRGATREMRFRNIFSRDDHFPEGRFIVIEHQTPELIWQEEFMDHPNGARSLEEVTFVAADVESTVSRIGALAGARPSAVSGGATRFRLPAGGILEVVTPEAFAERSGGAPPSQLPCVASCAIGVSDLDAALKALDAGGVKPRWSSDTAIGTDPADSNGVELVFREQP